MSNTTTGIFETLVAKLDSAAEALNFKTTMLDSVNTTLQPGYSTIGKTLQFNVPTVDTSLVTNIGAGSISKTDTDHSSVNVVFNKKWSTAWIEPSFDQLLSAIDLEELDFGGRLESLLRKANADIVALVTPGNFGTYAAITGGADVFTRTHMKSSWANLVGAGVEPSPSNTYFTTSHVVYANMLDDDSFKRNDIVAMTAAESVQQNAHIVPQFNTTLQYDQQFPVSTGAYTGLHYHKNAIAVRYGVEKPLGGYVKEYITYIRGKVPVKFQTWPSPDNQGQMFHLSLCYGSAVIRPELASVLIST